MSGTKNKKNLVWANLDVVP